MESTPSRDLATLVDGTRHLWGRRRPAALVALAGILLGAVGPGLHLLSGLPGDRDTATLLMAVGLLPMEIFFIPRFLLRLDAELGEAEGQASLDWRAAFEARWLRAFGAKLLLAALVALGIMALVLPALVVLLAFGWAPMRVLLRGERIGEALRGSVLLMRRAWRRAFLVVCAAFAIAFGLGIAVEVPLVLLAGEPKGLLALVHPALLLLRAVESVLSLWLSIVLLLLYRRLAPREGRTDPG